MKYAHENGCPWDGKVLEMTSKWYAKACLKYANDNGCSWPGSNPHDPFHYIFPYGPYTGKSLREVFNQNHKYVNMCLRSDKLRFKYPDINIRIPQTTFDRLFNQGKYSDFFAKLFYCPMCHTTFKGPYVNYQINLPEGGGYATTSDDGNITMCFSCFHDYNIMSHKHIFVNVGGRLY